MNPPPTFTRLVRDTAGLPLFDLNYRTGNEVFDLYPNHPSFPRRGLLGCVAVFLGKLLQETLRWRPGQDARVPDGVVLVAVETKNQRDALLPVQERLPGSALINLEAQPGLPFPTAAAYWAAIPFLPLLWRHHRQASAYRRSSFAHVLHHYWLTYGYYLVGRRWLRRHRPRLLFVANDHNMKTRTLCRAARDEGVPTAYIQHASVSEKFPPLSFDLAFLDGEDALAKYEANATADGAGTRVFLAGIPKLDAHVADRNRHDRLRTLGVCINMLDPTERVKDLCAGLLASFPDLPLVLRPHPGDPRDWPTLLPQPGMAHSDAKSEPAFAFLARVDGIVAGDSNISLEALLMNVTPLYYDFPAEGRDNYGFVRRGVVPYFRDPQPLHEAVAALRQRRPEVLALARPYCATVGTPHDGASAALVAGTVQRALDADAADPAVWQPRPGGALRAYLPRAGTPDDAVAPDEALPAGGAA